MAAILGYLTPFGWLDFGSTPTPLPNVKNWNKHTLSGVVSSFTRGYLYGYHMTTLNLTINEGSGRIEWSGASGESGKFMLEDCEVTSQHIGTTECIVLRDIKTRKDVFVFSLIDSSASKQIQDDWLKACKRISASLRLMTIYRNGAFIHNSKEMSEATERYLNLTAYPNHPLRSDGQNRSMLYLACQIGASADKRKAVKALLVNGADPNIGTLPVMHRNGMVMDTPLHAAIAADDYECVELLLTFKADVTISGEKGEKPIHALFMFNRLIAEHEKRPEGNREQSSHRIQNILQMMWTALGDQDAKIMFSLPAAHTGKTILYSAIEDRLESVVKMLLELAPEIWDFEMKQPKKMTYHQLAESLGEPVIANLIADAHRKKLNIPHVAPPSPIIPVPSPVPSDAEDADGARHSADECPNADKKKLREKGYRVYPVENGDKSNKQNENEDDKKNTKNKKNKSEQDTQPAARSHTSESTATASASASASETESKSKSKSKSKNKSKSSPKTPDEDSGPKKKTASAGKRPNQRRNVVTKLTRKPTEPDMYSLIAGLPVPIPAPIPAPGSASFMASLPTLPPIPAPIPAPITRPPPMVDVPEDEELPMQAEINDDGDVFYPAAESEPLWKASATIGSDDQIEASSRMIPEASMTRVPPIQRVITQLKDVQSTHQPKDV